MNAPVQGVLELEHSLPFDALQLFVLFYPLSDRLARFHPDFLKCTSQLMVHVCLSERIYGDRVKTLCALLVR